ncbi:hypothetical protein ABJI51_42055 [Amycolatopsis sp. NEAU-NG30]|uniref:Integral membrane protein n=1 Tax=Amycolatopsis melonis TaxID=3156488 RepID=A0ABV0LU77_9PSEU
MEEVISDDELAQYAKGRFVLWALRLRPTYYRLLREGHGPEALCASELAQRLAPDNTELPGKIRDSVFRIGAYQIWSRVQQSDEVVDKVLAFMFYAVLAGTLGGAVFHADGSFWRRLLYAVVAFLTSGLVALAGLLLSDVRTPRSRRTRALAVLLGFGALMAAGWWLSRWQSVWGLGLSAGIFIAAAALFALAILYQVANALVQSAFRISWTKWTAAELTQTLAVTHWSLLNEPEPYCLQSASSRLQHVSLCVERFLPQYLTMTFPRPSATSALHHDHREFAEVAATIRLLARECLLPKSATRTAVADKVGRLLTTAAQGQWGEWEKTAPEEAERSARRWRWITGALRFGLGVLPLVVVTVGALYLYRTNPASPLLKAEVLAPVLVATLGFLTASLGSPATTEKTGRRKPFGSRSPS